MKIKGTSGQIEAFLYGVRPRYFPSLSILILNFYFKFFDYLCKTQKTVKMNKKQKLISIAMLYLQWLAVALPVVLLIYNFNVKNILFSLFSLVLSHVIYRFRCDFHHRIQIKRIEKSYSELNRRNRRAVIRKIKSAK